jgi:predicted TIM-barrel enzyme
MAVDAVMFSNEFNMPYLTKVHTVTVAAMAHYRRTDA